MSLTDFVIRKIMLLNLLPIKIYLSLDADEALSDTAERINPGNKR